MLNHQETMRIHVETLFTHDPDGRMVHVNEPGGKPAPRFFLGRTSQGSVWRFRRDLDEDLAEAMEAVCLAEPAGHEFLAPPYGSTPYEELLARHAPIERRWAGPAYRFPRELETHPETVLVTEENAELLSPYLEGWIGDVPLCQPMLAVVAGSRAVSVCCSVRKGLLAHEAGVETARDFRGHGHATKAVSAWAAAVSEESRIPLYSTSWDNVASRAVARSLRLERYGADLHIT